MKTFFRTIRGLLKLTGSGNDALFKKPLHAIPADVAGKVTRPSEWLIAIFAILFRKWELSRFLAEPRSAAAANDPIPAEP
jgi:hypothetical protein